MSNLTNRLLCETADSKWPRLMREAAHRIDELEAAVERVEAYARESEAENLPMWGAALEGSEDDDD